MLNPLKETLWIVRSRSLIQDPQGISCPRPETVLRNKGFQVLHIPIFDIHPLVVGSLPDIQGCQGLIVTSPNTILILDQWAAFKNIPLYCVGTGTTQMALSCGFRVVFNAKGTGKDLLAFIQKNCAPDSGFFIYARAQIIRIDLANCLKNLGFFVTETILYQTNPLPDFSAEALSNLITNQLWGILFFSPQGAIHFKKLIIKRNLGKFLEMVYFFCLSSAVARPLYGLGKKIKIAKHPDVEALLETIYDAKAKNNAEICSL